MNDRDALLTAIGEHPEEDTPRLMYADWLEENGDPERADFVRNQVELARAAPGDKYPFVKKNKYYLANFERHWHSQLTRIDGVEWGDFNRGLIEEVRAASERPIIDHAERIFAVPGIHILRLGRLNDGKRLAAVPELTRLRMFWIVAVGTPAATLRELFASPYLGKLTKLDLYGSGVDDALAAEIADGRFPDMAELLLGSNEVGYFGAMALANSPNLGNIRAINLWNNRINNAAAQGALRKRFGKALTI
jgi:uncharacterized protein (TIGR02996 family)